MKLNALPSRKHNRRIVYSIIALACCLTAVVAIKMQVHPSKKIAKKLDAWEHSPSPSMMSSFHNALVNNRVDPKGQPYIYVTQDMVSFANRELYAKRSLPLTVDEACRLSGQDLSDPGARHYYLMRAYQGAIVLTLNNYVWVNCGVLTSKSDVRILHHPIITSVDHVPVDVYLTFSVAK